MKTAKLSDRDLIIKIKDTQNPEDYELLYKRYMPMINKYAFKIGTAFKSNMAEIIEEFKQDGYIALLETINYIKLEKIYDDKWTFNKVFYYFLKPLQMKYYKNYSHRDDSLDGFSDYLENPDDGFHGTAIKLKKVSEAIGVPSNYYKDFENDIKKFMKELEPRQYEVVKRRQLGMTIKNIATELKVSYGTIHRDIHIAKEKATMVFNL